MGIYIEGLIDNPNASVGLTRPVIRGGMDISGGIDISGTISQEGTDLASSIAELNKLSGVTAVPADLNLVSGLVAAGVGLVKVATVTVDCSEGGTAETEDIVTLPAGTVILELTTYCSEAFDGDTTKSFEVGIEGNTDKYIDPVDCPVTLDGVMSMMAGTNNDQKVPEVLAAETAIIATWTNTAEMTKGTVVVKVIYC